MEKLFYAVFNAVLATVSFIFRGFLVSKLWLWFIVSTFAVPAISVPVAIGIGILATLLTVGTPYKTTSNEDEDDKFTNILSDIICTTGVFALALVVRAFV